MSANVRGNVLGQSVTYSVKITPFEPRVPFVEPHFNFNIVGVNLDDRLDLNKLDPSDRLAEKISILNGMNETYHLTRCHARRRNPARSRDRFLQFAITILRARPVTTARARSLGRIRPLATTITQARPSPRAHPARSWGRVTTRAQTRDTTLHPSTFRWKRGRAISQARRARNPDRILPLATTITQACPSPQARRVPTLSVPARWQPAERRSAPRCPATPARPANRQIPTRPAVRHRVETRAANQQDTTPAGIVTR